MLGKTSNKTIKAQKDQVPMPTLGGNFLKPDRWILKVGIWQDYQAKTTIFFISLQAHNSHAVPRARRRLERGSNPILPASGSRYTGETFHFVSYVPFNGHLFELDGLKKWPIDHGEIGDGHWTEKFRQVRKEKCLFLINH